MNLYQWSYWENYLEMFYQYQRSDPESRSHKDDIRDIHVRVDDRGLRFNTWNDFARHLNDIAADLELNTGAPKLEILTAEMMERATWDGVSCRCPCCHDDMHGGEAVFELPCKHWLCAGCFNEVCNPPVEPETPPEKGWHEPEAPRGEQTCPSCRQRFWKKVEVEVWKWQNLNAEASNWERQAEEVDSARQAEEVEAAPQAEEVESAPQAEEVESAVQ